MTWRIDFDALAVSVTEDIADIREEEVTRLEKFTEIIRDVIGSTTKKADLDFENIEPSIDAMVEEFQRDITLTLESRGQEIGEATVRFVPIGATADREVITPILVSDRIVNRLAEERFNIDELEELGEGVSRQAYAIDEDKVLKVLEVTTGDFLDVASVAQHMAEGLEEGFPKVLERGLDYVVVERADPDYARAREVLGEAIRIYSAIEYEQHREMGFDTKEDAYNALKTELERVDKEQGSNLASVFKYDTVELSDMLSRAKARVNIGFRDDVPVLIDPGTISLKDSDKFLEDIGSSNEQAIEDMQTIFRRQDRMEVIRSQKEDRDLGKIRNNYEGARAQVNTLHSIGRSALSGDEIVDMINRGEDVNLVHGAFPERLVQLYKEYKSALQVAGVRKRIGKVDYLPAIHAKVQNINMNRVPITTDDDFRKQQENTFNDMLDYMNEQIDHLEAMGEEVDDVMLEARDATVERLSNISNLSLAVENKIVMMTDVIPAIIVREVLSNTNFELKYSVLGDDPGIQYKKTLESAVAEVADFYIKRLTDVMKEILITDD